VRQAERPTPHSEGYNAGREQAEAIAVQGEVPLHAELCGTQVLLHMSAAHLGIRFGLRFRHASMRFSVLFFIVHKCGKSQHGVLQCFMSLMGTRSGRPCNAVR
jgi:hypothetical protein